MLDPFLRLHEDRETVSLTQSGAIRVGEMYLQAKRGVPIEELEEQYGLFSGPEGTEEHHIEWRILMTCGEISGLFDHLEEMLELDAALEAVEDNYLYGDEDVQ